MDYYKALRVLALAEVTADEPGTAYSLRRIFRWYSEKFSTPLHLVDDLPMHDVLQHYYEANFEKLVESSETELRNELLELSRTPEEERREKERREREAYETDVFEQEAAEEARAHNELKKKMLAEQAANPKPRPTLQSPSVRQSNPMSRDQMQDLGFEAPAEPEIKMTFIDLEELDRLSDADSLDIDPLVGLK